jgi:hypothetical protein
VQIRPRLRLLAALVLAQALAQALAGPGMRPAAAHAGPPFPLFEDRRSGPYLVSVWSDPDIGTGTFFVLLAAPEGGRPAPPRAVRIAVQPVSGRLSEAVHEAVAEEVREGARFYARFYAEVPFDRGGTWRVRVVVASAEGSGELTTEVEPTPDGTIGPISLALYAIPFLAVGFLWLKAALRGRGGTSHAGGANQLK